MTDPTLDNLLEVAMDAAYLAGRRTLAYFNAGVAVETKADRTPVTVADREAEQIIRSTIGRTFPDHAVLGEEAGLSNGNPDFLWIIDPIDGTKSFIHGVPLYGVLIAVEVRGQPSVGVIYIPPLDEMVAAATGLGCRHNGRLTRVSQVSRLDEALLLTTSPFSCMARSDAYQKLAGMTRLNRSWGDCYGYLLVATGRAEIMLDPKMNVWDCAALPPILSEAGGQFTDWKGNPTIRAEEGLATNGLLHEPVLEFLREGDVRR